MTANDNQSQYQGRLSRQWSCGCLAVVLILLAVLISAGSAVVPQYVRFLRDKARIEPLLPAMDPLIDALERYGRDHGQYPIRLEPLVPKYLAALPRLQWPLSGGVPGEGYGYEYAVESGGGYVLMAQVSRQPNHYAIKWTEYVVYEGPGYDPAPEDRPYGRIGKWKYYSAH